MRTFFIGCHSETARYKPPEVAGEFTGQGPREKAGAQREAGCRNLQRGSRESLARNPSGCVCKETESGERTARNR